MGTEATSGEDKGEGNPGGGDRVGVHPVEEDDLVGEGVHPVGGGDPRIEGEVALEGDA